MIEIRHAGIYVKNLPLMEDFYKNVFQMKVIQHQVVASDAVIDSIICPGAKVVFSKLITPRGVESGTGDMVELLHFVDDLTVPQFLPVFQAGTSHIGIGVDNMDVTVALLEEMGGKQQTQIVQMGQNKCCFCTDPEQNWIELIQRGV